MGILAHEFPGSAHIRDVGLRAAEDGQIWDHARTQGLMIVSKDTDFRGMAERVLAEIEMAIHYSYNREYERQCGRSQEYASQVD